MSYNELKPYSIHSFMLPFRWDYLPAGFDGNKQGKEEISFERRTDLKKFRELLVKSNSKWKRRFFRINGQVENFNEIHYFHAYASSTMFDLQRVQEKDESMIYNNKVMVYYELEVEPETDRYIISVADHQKQEIYTLHLTGISLHVYDTGVAILTINVENHDYDKKQDILYINEYGRRIYPQFLSNGELPTSAVKGTFLAAKLQVTIAGIEGLEDDFSEYDNLQEREVHHYHSSSYERSWVVRAPKYIRGLFGNNFCFIQHEEQEKKMEEKIRLNILTDDRMFFQCWYGNDGLAYELKELKPWYNIQTQNKEYAYLTSNFWHAYLFGDKKDPAIANRQMQKNLTAKHTYARWAGYGTLYGFSRDSFVAVSDTVPTLLDKYAPNLRLQMKTMYYQMALLCLAQRASVLRFSAEVTLLAGMIKTGEDKKLVENIKELYQNYIEFVNKVNYKEITPYIQGIEMYCHFRQIMEVQENVKTLDGELNELFNYIKLQEDKKQGDEAHNLTKIAAWFLPAGFIASLFGIGFITDNTLLIGEPDNKIWIAWAIIIFGGALLSGIFFFFLKKGKNDK